MINIEAFIAKHITFREKSFFQDDLLRYENQLRSKIEGKSALVIGGGGTIGSSFIRAMLKFNPAKLYVVDLSENYLTELTRDLRSTLGMKVPDEYKTYPISFSDPVFDRILQDAVPSTL
jgi:FlaA1/EpsC-like NDP-sugar epimerase